MLQPSSSTSSSDLPDAGEVDVIPLVQLWRRRREGKGLVVVLLSVVVALAAIDRGVDALFSVPPVAAAEGFFGLTRYFEFGRSVEGKLKRMIGPADAETSPTYLEGWRVPQTAATLPAKPMRGGPLIAMYGMSFTKHLAAAVERVDPSATVRLVIAPSAPPSHALTMSRWDHDQHEAAFVVLNILSGALAYTNTMTGMTWGFEQPFPFTYPRYYDRDGKLQAIEPVLQSLEDLRMAMKDSDQWDRFIDQLAEHDDRYRPELFDENILDELAIMRLTRRAWATRMARIANEHAIDNDRFDLKHPGVAILPLIVKAFAAEARAAGHVPIVFMVQQRGDEDRLYRLLESVLKEHKIEYVSNHEIDLPTGQPQYLPDGHLTKAMNDQLAEALIGKISDW
jgi:hypothetical protein